MHVASGYLIVAIGRLARFRLQPASDEEAAVSLELFESLAQIVPNAGETTRFISNRLDPLNLIPLLLGITLSTMSVIADGPRQASIALAVAGLACTLVVARRRIGSRVVRSFVRVSQDSTLRPNQQ